MKEFIWDEFMKPLHISTSQLAHDIQVPESKIKNVLDGKEKVSADLSIRLGKYFNLPEDYLLNIQNDIDTRVAKRNHAAIFKKIKPIIPSNKKDISLA
ncbi:hypothetical protein FC39_GL000728 [Lactobacillus hamsteri DSM 5661 = JCM 6256]|uniref:HTH cro/C1-type domain-containing protein n=2 Tax=Lactobacillus hamsteri TaxID=96565 RepID=A0A0R1YCR3_9LACO|nr:hypothetical protein FC39_GL000728 [Lactobacillus hamsteri DSM 5661 = JCM 6256]